VQPLVSTGGNGADASPVGGLYGGAESPPALDAAGGIVFLARIVNGQSSEAIVYRALDRVGEQTGKPPVEVLEQAVKTVTPVLEVRPRRVGGANYQVPVEVPQRRARTLAVRLLLWRSASSPKWRPGPSRRRERSTPATCWRTSTSPEVMT